MAFKTQPRTERLSLPRPRVHPSLMAFDELPDSAFVPLLVVCTLFACSPATVWRRVRSGQLVAPLRIGSRTTRWMVRDLREMLATVRQEGK